MGICGFTEPAAGQGFGRKVTGHLLMLVTNSCSLYSHASYPSMGSTTISPQRPVEFLFKADYLRRPRLAFVQRYGRPQKRFNSESSNVTCANTESCVRYLPTSDKMLIQRLDFRRAGFTNDLTGLHSDALKRPQTFCRNRICDHRLWLPDPVGSPVSGKQWRQRTLSSMRIEFPRN